MYIYLRHNGRGYICYLRHNGRGSDLKGRDLAFLRTNKVHLRRQFFFILKIQHPGSFSFKNHTI